jgi:hypothetical protein
VTGRCRPGKFAYHPRLVSTPRHPSGFVALLVAVSLLGAACDSGGDTDGDNPPPDGQMESPRPDEGPGTVGTTPGKYEYRNAGLIAKMNLETDPATLTIVNDTGRTLPKPDFYILDARDGTQIDGKVDASSSIPDGQEKQFDITIQGQIELQNIGLVLLLMGEDNYGAFVNL